MHNNYAFLSEVMRTNVWAMLPESFNWYKGVLMAGRGNGSQSPVFDLSFQREEGSLLVFHPGKTDPETRLIQTIYPHWYSETKLQSGDQIIHILPITGPVTHGGAECSLGTRELADRFMYADRQPSVVGHLVLLDTPGGSSGANDLDAVFANAQKPVVGLIRGMNASKGVWISSFIPHVFAEREDVQIGCIGCFWALSGIRNGVNAENKVYYEVYATNSIHKNNEYREAIQNDNLQPAQEAVDEVDALFRANVKNRWPAVPDDKLTGRMYNAKDVIGELVDGIKSYDQAIDYIFTLAGKPRNQAGFVTPLGVVPAVSAQPGTKQSASGTEEPVQTHNNTNPQKTLTRMANIKALEQILGEGSVLVDENGNAQLTTEQIQKLDEHYAKGSAALNLVNTQAQTIAGLQESLTKKDSEIKELAEATGKPIEQPAVETDDVPDPKAAKAPLLAGVTDPIERYNRVSAKAKEMGLIQ